MTVAIAASSNDLSYDIASGATGSFTITSGTDGPSGIADGNILVLIAAVAAKNGNNEARIDTLAGWTQISYTNWDFDSSAYGPGFQMQAFYKVAASEPSSYTWTTRYRDNSSHNATSDAAYVVAKVFRVTGGDASTPIDLGAGALARNQGINNLFTSSTYQTSGSGTHFTTVTAAASLVFHFLCNIGRDTYNDPAGVTRQCSVAGGTTGFTNWGRTNGGGTGLVLEVASESLSASGTPPSRTFTPHTPLAGFGSNDAMAMAFAIPAGPTTVPVTSAVETDSAPRLGVIVDDADEADSALHIQGAYRVAVTSAVETDSAPAVAVEKIVQVVPASEADSAPRITAAPRVAREADAASAIIRSHSTAGWPVSSKMNARVEISSFARAVVVSPPVTPPDGHVYLKRARQIMPAPDLAHNGWPDRDTWIPDSEILEDWGHFEIRFGGRDYTFYRGIPAQVVSVIDGEPFGDATAVVHFPQISPFEFLPSWITETNVDIWQRKPDGSKGAVIFEGLSVSVEDGDATEGAIVQIIGALYQLDFFLKQPYLVDPGEVDVGTLLAQEITPAHQDRASFRCLPLAKMPMGVALRPSGSWQPTLTGYCADILARAQLALGVGFEWTVLKGPGRAPYSRVKDRTSVHWRMRLGQHGIKVALSLDTTTAPTSIYGDGTDVDHCHWRNAKYPNLHADEAPVFPGTLMYPGNDYGDEMRTFETEMHDHGWGFTVNGDYASSEEPLVRRFQEQAGIEIDGVIGPQTWAACFEPGSREGDLSGAFIQELSSIRQVVQYNRNPAGAVISDNVDFNKNILRVERPEHFGAQISKDEGVRSTTQEIARDWPASWVGTIELTADPNEGSRFEIKSGHNFLLQNHHGEDRLLHIAKREIDATADPIKVKLTVDEKARDLMTLGAILARNRESTDPTRRQREYRNRKSKLMDDTIPVWDCENGAGIIPRHATYKKLWNVLHIPAGKLGSIVRAEFQVETPTQFAVGIFDRPVTAAQLVRAGYNTITHDFSSPLDSPDYWDRFPDSNEADDPRREQYHAPDGCIIAWGSQKAPGGIWPYREITDEGAFVTGKSRENALWYFESQQAPWLWVAIYVGDVDSDTPGPDVNYFSGRLFPSNEL